MREIKKYSVEFKIEAIKTILEQQLSYPEASKRLGVPEGTLHGWMHKYKSNQFSETLGAGKQTSDELRCENTALRKELAQVKLEREILKNRLHGAPCPT